MPLPTNGLTKAQLPVLDLVLTGDMKKLNGIQTERGGTLPFVFAYEKDHMQ
ncbi:MAG: hypothetical protein NO474_00285 [Methanomassiliicoccales archaeon]|jgi:hypothetical protein|nr:hypothetical protein [Methanomassiliicoccales archaeon]